MKLTPAQKTMLASLAVQQSDVWLNHMTLGALMDRGLVVDDHTAPLGRRLTEKGHEAFRRYCCK